MNLGDNGVTYMSLPPNFQTEENDALGYAVDRQLKKLMEAAGSIAVWTNTRNVPKKYYDYMAASIRAPYYASQYNENTRLGILESAFQVYMFAGTCKGVEELVCKVFSGEAIFIPWYEYNGKAYHFKISVHSSPVRDTHNKFKKILKRVQSKRSVLDLVEYIINLIIQIPEKMDITKIHLKVQVSYWGCKLVNGTKLLDGSGLLNASRRYNLVPGIKNNIKAYIKENIYTGRLYINILPCFNVHENIDGLKTVFRLGSCFLWDSHMPGKQDMPLSITVPVYASIAQEINIARIVINGIKVCTEEKTSAASVLRAAINSLPVKSGLPAKAGYISRVNTLQGMDIRSLVISGIKVHTEEKAGAASGLKAGINHYKTPGGTRVALPASTWHKAAVVTHESIKGFTVTPEEVTCTIIHNNTILDHCSMVINGQNFDNTSDYVVKGFDGKDNTVTIVFTPDKIPVYKFTDNTKPSLQSQDARLVSTTVNGDGTAEMVIAFNSNTVCVISARPLYTVRRFTVTNTDADSSINVYVDGMSIGTRIRKSEGSFSFDARTGQSVTFDATPDDGYILKDNGFYVVNTYKTCKLSEALIVTEDIFKEDVKTLIYVTPLAELKKYNVNIEYLDNGKNLDAYVMVAGASGIMMQAGTNKTFSITHNQTLSVNFDCRNNSLGSTPSILVGDDEIFLDYYETEKFWYIEYVVISDSPIWICLNN